MRKVFFPALFLFFMLYGALQAKSLVIAGTADLQGVMTPSLQRFDLDGDGKKSVKLGGITRLATIFRRLKAKNPATLILSSGDDLMGKYFHTFKGKAIFTLMPAAGYDYFIFGNHEFDHGPDELAKALGVAKFTTICSDLLLTKSFHGKTVPYVIREIAGTKVGIFSLMSENFSQMTNPGEVRQKIGNVAMAKKMVALLEKKGAKVIIALTHIGYKNDVAIAKQVKGIDLIFGGHSHHYPKKMGHIGKTAIVNGGERGSLVVVVNLPLDAQGYVIHEKVRMHYIPVKMSIPEASDVVRILRNYQKRLPPVVVLGRSEAPWDLRVKVLRKGESGVADMIDDLLRKRFGVDIVLNNSGAFRGKAIYPAGPVTSAMLQAIDEFHNAAYIMELNGTIIRQILEHSAAKYGEGGWLQVSGIRFQVDLREQPQKIQGERIVQRGKRVSDIQVLLHGTWTPLEDKRYYSVLSNAFLVLRAGDGYYWFRKFGKHPINTYTTFYSIMAQELHAKKVLTPPPPDGRIHILR